MRIQKILCLTAIMLCLVSNYSCGVEDSINNAVEVIDNAVADITAESSNWRATLEGALEDLPDTAHETKSEVSQLLNESIGAASSNIICVLDAIPTRVKRVLNRIKSRLLLEEASPFQPEVCQVSLPVIDLNNATATRRTIIVNGYDFDNTDLLEFRLTKNDGQSIILENRIDRQTYYQYTIDIAGIEDLLGTYDKLVILFAGEELHRFDIVHIEAPTLETIEFKPADFGPECPVHIGGDKEFDGHGPNVTAGAEIYIVNDKEVWVDISFHLKETRSNWTEAKGDWSYKIWPTPQNPAPPNYRISRILSSTRSSLSYEDTDHHPDQFQRSGLVKLYRCVGDTGGDDVGRCNGDNDANISMQFNVVRFEVELE